MNLVLLQPHEIQNGVVRLKGRRAEHISSVLRTAIGDSVRVGVVRGGSGIGKVVSLEDGQVVLSVLIEQSEKDFDCLPELVLALPRPKVLSRCLYLAACLGTRRIHIVNSWRVDKAYFQSPKLSPTDMTANCMLGLEQGTVTWLPDIIVHQRFMEFCEKVLVIPPPLGILAEPSGQFRIAETVTQDKVPSIIAIGPEGGWIQREIDTFKDKGFHDCRLNMPVLRVEHAIAAVYAQVAAAKFA